MADIFGLAGALGAAAINSTASRKNAQFQLDAASQLNKEAAELNYQYGERSADAATERSIRLYNELQSPAARVKQLKDAGLSVGLMYGMGGSSGASVPQGAQGQGAGGQQGKLPTALPYNPELGLMMAEIAKTTAEAKNIQQDTDNKKTEQKKTTAEISQILAETKSEGLKQRGYELDNIFKEINNSTSQIENWITKETATDKVEQISIQLDKAEAEINQIIAETRKTNLDADTQQQIIDKVRERYTLEMDKIRSEIILNASQQKLNNAQAEQAIDIAEKVAEETKFIPEYFKNDLKKANAYVQEVNNRLRAANIQAGAQVTAAAILAAGNVTSQGFKNLLDMLTPEQKSKILKWKPFKPSIRI